MEKARWRITDKVMVSEIQASVESDVYNNKPVVKRNNYFIFSTFTIPSREAKSYKFLGTMGVLFRIG